MIVAGKCPPEPEALESANERGFSHVELYLEKRHLDYFQESVDAVRNSGVEVVSVHTPHVTLENQDYFVLADKLAQKLNAFLVFHSQYLQHTHIPELEKLGLNAEYGYENNPGINSKFLESIVINEGHKLVLDTAHFYLGNPDTEHLEEFMRKNLENIGLIHLCDATETQDGVGFGEGVMDMKEVCRIINRTGFDGAVVLEVMPGKQREAKEKWKKYINA